MKRVLLQEAYVLHRRPYRESSFLLELLTKEYGRISVLIKGARKPKSPLQGLLQPFTPLLVSWVGRQELMVLSRVKAIASPFQLRGECLFAGFYLNELLVHLLQKWEAFPSLYLMYEKTLSWLGHDHLDQKILRMFEKQLLIELGYGVLLKSDLALQQTFSKDQYYEFIPGEGFILSQVSAGQKSTHFLGQSLLDFAQENWQDDASLQDAKRLMRLIFANLLGDRILHSRLLF